MPRHAKIVIAYIGLMIAVLLFFQCGKDQGVNPSGQSRLVVAEIIGPPNAEINTAELYRVIIRNHGDRSDETYRITLYKTGDNELATITSSEPISRNHTKTFDLTWTPTELEEFRMYARVSPVGENIANADTSAGIPVYTFPENEKQYLVWDNDNDSYYIRPVSGYRENCQVGLNRTITQNGLETHIVNTLPKALRNYDIVFIELGVHCPT